MVSSLKIRLVKCLSTFVLPSLLLTTLVLGGCSKKDDTTTTPAPVEQSTIKLADNATLGSFLTDGAGNTLYYFALDVNGSNACGSATCAAQWPVFYDAELKVGPGLSATDFSAGKTADGRDQTFYKGWPLYYYAPAANGQNVREPAGATNGNGVGKVWYVVRPDYSLMLATNSVTSKSTKQTSTKSYLIDPQGRTLYTFGKDARLPESQPTNCQGGCIATWPVFYQATIATPSGLKASDFGTITRTDGPNGTTRQQTTYKGQPLYYFTPDNSVRGKAEGDGVNGGGDLWSVAIKD